MGAFANGLGDQGRGLVPVRGDLGGEHLAGGFDLLGLTARRAGWSLSKQLFAKNEWEETP
jgi:hypothetical protein